MIKTNQTTNQNKQKQKNKKMSIKFKEGDILLANNFNFDSTIYRLEEDVMPLLQEKYKSLLKFIINVLKDKNTCYIPNYMGAGFYKCDFYFKTHQFDLVFYKKFVIFRVRGSIINNPDEPKNYFLMSIVGDEILYYVYDDNGVEYYLVLFNIITKEKTIKEVNK